jgi:hypothetical protein
VEDPHPVIEDIIQPNSVFLIHSKSLAAESQDAEIVREAQTALVDLYMVVRAETEDVLRYIRPAMRSAERSEMGCLSVGP